MRHFPKVRLRRLRRFGFMRDLVREHRLSVNDLIYPIFLTEGETTTIASMSGISRLSLDDLEALAPSLRNELGILMVALFPHIDATIKTPDGAEATNHDGLIPRAVRRLKACCPDLGVLTDAALDPYTSTGQDGISAEDGYVLNDETCEILARQALCCAEAGADVIAPSDMMDGRVGIIRAALDDGGFKEVAIMSYAAKYASAFYGPFRDAIGSASQLGASDKKTYQMDPANSDEAIAEVRLDLEEGADMVMVKPGMPYLDVLYRVKTTFRVPTFAYQVSGEYVMLKNAVAEGLLSEEILVESVLAFKRAGADGILTYLAPEIATLLR